MHGPMMLENLIKVYILTGEMEKALDEIKLLLKTSNTISPPHFYIDPVLAHVTDHVQFKKLENQFWKNYND
jgi:hypothetical protein